MTQQKLSGVILENTEMMTINVGHFTIFVDLEKMKTRKQMETFRSNS